MAEGDGTLGGVLFEHTLCKHQGPLAMGGKRLEKRATHWR